MRVGKTNREKRAWWERRSYAVSVLLVFVLLVFVLQLWMITIALEEHLAARSTLAWPTFLTSLGCFGLNLWLLKYLNDLDRERGKK
jgi:hypothetical protein